MQAPQRQTVLSQSFLEDEAGQQTLTTPFSSSGNHQSITHI